MTEPVCRQWGERHGHISVVNNLQAKREKKMTDYHRPDNKTLQTLRDIANKLRVHSIESTDASNSG